MKQSTQRQDVTERTVVTLCDKLESKPGVVARTLRRQLLRSGTSIGANIEETQAAQSSVDFINKYSISLKEARETIYWLRLLDATSSAKDDLKSLTREADEIARILGAIVVRTKNRRRDA